MLLMNGKVLLMSGTSVAEKWHEGSWIGAHGLTCWHAGGRSTLLCQRGPVDLSNAARGHRVAVKLSKQRSSAAADDLGHEQLRLPAVPGGRLRAADAALAVRARLLHVSRRAAAPS